MSQVVLRHVVEKENVARENFSIVLLPLPNCFLILVFIFRLLLPGYPSRTFSFSCSLRLFLWNTVKTSRCRCMRLPSSWSSWDYCIEVEDLLLVWWGLAALSIFCGIALGSASLPGQRSKWRVGGIGHVGERDSPASHHSNGMRRGWYRHSCHTQTRPRRRRALHNTRRQYDACSLRDKL